MQPNLLTCVTGALTPEREMETRKYIESNGAEPVDLLIGALASEWETKPQKYSPARCCERSPTENWLTFSARCRAVAASKEHLMTCWKRNEN